jgi:hypothetical protein
LWNPGDKLGMSLIACTEDGIGAQIKRLLGNSEALGVEKLEVGDRLISVNGIDVVNVPFATLCKFLKKTNVTCTLSFQSSTYHGECLNDFEEDSELHYPTSSSSSEADLAELPAYVKMTLMLEETMEKVQLVEDMVRFRSVMTL